MHMQRNHPSPLPLGVSIVGWIAGFITCTTSIALMEVALFVIHHPTFFVACLLVLYYFYIVFVILNPAKADEWVPAMPIFNPPPKKHSRPSSDSSKKNNKTRRAVLAECEDILADPPQRDVSPDTWITVPEAPEALEVPETPERVISSTRKKVTRAFSFASSSRTSREPDDGFRVRKNLRSKLFRGSSKLLSIFRNPSYSSKTVTVSSNSDPRRLLDTFDDTPSAAHEIPQPDPALGDNMSASSLSDSSPERWPTKEGALTSPSAERLYTFLLETPANYGLNNYSNDLALSESLASVQRKRSASLQRSQSNPGMGHRLIHRLSSTFGQPTVVHRPRVRSRPSARSMQEIAQAIEAINDRGSTEPSSYLSTNASSPRQRASTNPTTHSGSSSGPNMLPSERTRVLQLERPPLCLTPIAEHSVLDSPTIATVEATAVAKIFFEAHFNSIFYKEEPRAKRRENLERQLYAVDLSPEAKIRIRETWARQETEWLRQERILKSRSSRSERINGVSIGGYDVVKVLGKGSFGVVRLVKETKRKGSDESTSLSNIPSKRLSSADLAQIRAVAKELIPRKTEVKIKKEVYAMKVIRKAEMIRNAQEGHLRAERDLLVAASTLESRWIVPLIASFQDHSNLYLVMDYCIGGDFLGLLIRKNTLSEEVTKWYIAEMILCIEEAHRLRWIHRDVKPDNFLITASGHLKISDFGLAFDGEWLHDQSYYNNHRSSLVDKLGIKLEGDEQDKIEAQSLEASRRLANAVIGPKGSNKTAVDGPADGEKVLDWRHKMQPRNLAKSVVGTSQYMAPEVIRGEFYDGRCDWWSIGIIIYECLFGFTPFACENRQQTKLKILRFRTTLAFPVEHVSITPNAIDIILCLLREKERRLCSRKYARNDKPQNPQSSLVGEGSHLGRANDKDYQDRGGHFVYPNDAEDLKAHRFFNGIRWSELHLLRPPFVPRVKNPEDTKYFDEDEPISDIASDTESEAELYISPNIEENATAATGSHYHENQHIIPSGPIDKDVRIITPEKGYKPKGKMVERRDGDSLQRQLLKHGKTFVNGQGDVAAAAEFYHQLFSNPLHAPTITFPSSTPTKTAAQILGQATTPMSSTVKLTTVTADAKITAPRGNLHEEMRNLIPPSPSPKKQKKKAAEKKRPRDIALRDPTTARTVMEIRKKGAFLGYDWAQRRYISPPQNENVVCRPSGSGGGNGNSRDVLGRALQEVVNEEGLGSMRSSRGRKLRGGEDEKENAGGLN